MSGLAGTILVVGSRVDAETLTRARAMGVRGVIVAGFASKERRDFLASEARQRAALHRLPPFAVLVLDGAIRRPLAGPVQAVLAALSGREVAIVTDPPTLVFDMPISIVADRRSTWSGSGPGSMPGGRGHGPAFGLRRFTGGVHLEAGVVRSPTGTVIAIAARRSGALRLTFRLPLAR